MDYRESPQQQRVFRSHFTLVAMDGKKVVVEALKRNSRDAMAKAKHFRTLAGSQKTKEEADLYFQHALEEEAKANGYLRQAEVLSQLEFDKSSRQ